MKIDIKMLANVKQVLTPILLNSTVLEFIELNVVNLKRQA